MSDLMLGLPDIKYGHGSGSSLPLPVLVLSGISTFVAVVVSGISIWLQLRNYRKPLLQRMVVRIMLMVPLYGVSSLISLFSLEAAFFIDVVRDIYEAFVIYCFFVLLLDYLGGERSLLILLHGRPPVPAVFPVNLWRSVIDQSDPYTFLFLKRGILQYVQVKPLLAIASLIMKATGTYNEGDFRARSGYLYVSIVYNISICLALWCLAVFWMCVHDDLKPFRPVPKFLCVKGILFFSFWQSIAISFLVAVGVITRLGPYTDSEHISLGLTDTLICIEMPFFAIAHMYAFSYRDFTTPPAPVEGKPRAPVHVARMTLGYALRDAFGLKDLVEDTRATLRGKGINYRAFEPSEGGMHIGAARDRRIRAGLRYAAGGKVKYWLPDTDGDVTAPLFAADADADDVVHDAPDMHHRQGEARMWVPGDDGDGDMADEDAYALTFSDALAGPEDDALYEQAKMYVFGDYLYPVVDVSFEEAQGAMWAEEARVVRDIASGSRAEGTATFSGYGATQNGKRYARAYDPDDHGGGWDAGPPSQTARAPETPSPPRARARTISDWPPIASSSRTSSHQSPSPTPGHTPAPPSSRLHPSLPPLFRSSSAASSPRMPTKRMPLVQEDAVDLVVAADNLQVPSASTSARGSHSPRSPVLIRVWDEVGPGQESESGSVQLETEEGESEGEGERRGSISGSDVQFVLTVDDAEAETEARGMDMDSMVPEREDIGVVGVPYVRGEVYGLGLPEDGHNPWA